MIAARARVSVVNSESPAPPLINSVVIAASIAIVLLAMRAVSDILSPILLAIVLAITASPLLNWFKKRGITPWLALVLTIALVVAVILGIVWLVGSSVQEFKETLSAYNQRIAEVGQLLRNTSSKLGVDVDSLTADPLIAPDKMLQLVVGFAAGIVSSLSNWGLVLVTTVFLLVEETILPRKVQSVAEDNDPGILRLFRLNHELREYMAINAVVGLLAAVLNVILLLIIGVDFALLWGLLFFFMSFIPGVGFLIALVPPAIMAMIQFGTTEMLIVITFYAVTHFALYNVIKPLFIEKDVNISIAVTFLSLIVWAWVLGPIGAILAVPMTIIVQAILDSREETRWLAYLMGGGSEPFKPKEELDQALLE